MLCPPRLVFDKKSANIVRVTGIYLKGSRCAVQAVTRLCMPTPSKCRTCMPPSYGGLGCFESIQVMVMKHS